jgi:hypothetical protein
MTPLSEAALADIKGWYGARFNMIVQAFRSEQYMPYSEFQLYLSRDGVNGFPALTLYRYIFPDAVAIIKARHNG